MISRARVSLALDAVPSDAKSSSKEESSSASVAAAISDLADMAVSEPKISAPRSLKALNPIGSKLGSPAKPLPPINSVGLDGGNDSWVLDSQMSALEDRKRRAEEAFRKNQERLGEQRRADEEAKRRLLTAVAETTGNKSAADTVDSAEDERARKMRELRERMISKKKAERDEKVRQEEEIKGKKKSDDKTGSPAKPKDPSISRFIEEQRKAGHEDDTARREVEEAERKRAQVRRAMAMHMRRELGENEEQKFMEDEMTQFSDLDKKLKKLEHMYESSNQRNAVLGEHFRAQEVHLANAKKTASSLRELS